MAANIERALTQRDEFGRIMTPKERFRVLNYGCACKRASCLSPHACPALQRSAVDSLLHLSPHACPALQRSAVDSLLHLSPHACPALQRSAANSLLLQPACMPCPAALCCQQPPVTASSMPCPPALSCEQPFASLACMPCPPALCCM